MWGWDDREVWGEWREDLEVIGWGMGGGDRHGDVVDK